MTDRTALIWTTIVFAACGARSRHYADAGIDGDANTDPDTDADTDIDSDVDSDSNTCALYEGTPSDAGVGPDRECVSHAENAAPFAPLPLYPVAGECVCQVRPTFLIGNSGDPDGDALRHHLQLDSDPGFWSADLQETPPDGLLQEPAGVSEWVMPRPLRDGQTYYWRTWADDCFLESERVVSVFSICL